MGVKLGLSFKGQTMRMFKNTVAAKENTRTNIVTVVESRRIRWVRYVARIGIKIRISNFDCKFPWEKTFCCMVFLADLAVPELIKKFLPFIEPGCAVLCLQKSVIRPYREPV